MFIIAAGRNVRNRIHLRSLILATRKLYILYPFQAHIGKIKSRSARRVTIQLGRLSQPWPAKRGTRCFGRCEGPGINRYGFSAGRGPAAKGEGRVRRKDERPALCFACTERSEADHAGRVLNDCGLVEVRVQHHVFAVAIASHDTQVQLLDIRGIEW